MSNEPNSEPSAISAGRLTPSRVAEILGIGKHTVWKLIGTGALRATDVGTAGTPRWKITNADLQAFLDRRANVSKLVVTGDRAGSENLSSTKRIVGKATR